jgi:Icc-related predicted phosphoesterase
MKIQVISDVHTEFHKDSGREFVDKLDPEGVDVLVVAGDLCDHGNIWKTLTWLTDAYRHVVYVLGNHESWGSSIQRSRSQTEAVAKSVGNLHFLDNSTCEIDGQRFVGTTMWFRDMPDNVFHEDFPDFKKIRNLRNTVYGENSLARTFLNHTIAPGDIVVTHHMPSGICVSNKFKQENWNRFFVCDMDDVIFDQKPKLWIHGHTHDSKDFMHESTHIVCNPFGYAGSDLNLDYEDRKIVEV